MRSALAGAARAVVVVMRYDESVMIGPRDAMTNHLRRVTRRAGAIDQTKHGPVREAGARRGVEIEKSAAAVVVSVIGAIEIAKGNENENEKRTGIGSANATAEENDTDSDTDSDPGLGSSNGGYGYSLLAIERRLSKSIIILDNDLRLITIIISDSQATYAHDVYASNLLKRYTITPGNPDLARIHTTSCGGRALVAATTHT